MLTAELLTPEVTTAVVGSGAVVCQTRDTVFDILTATPAPSSLPPADLLICLACRLVPTLETALVAMLSETVLIMAVALAIPCLVRMLGLGAGDTGWCEPPGPPPTPPPPPTGEREDLTLPLDLTDKECLPKPSPSC